MSSKSSRKESWSKSPKYTSPLRPIGNSSRSSSNRDTQIKFLDLLENSLEYLRENKMPPQNSLIAITRVCKKPLEGINIESSFPVYKHLNIKKKLDNHSTINDLRKKQIILQSFITGEQREKEFDDKLAKVLKEDKSIIVELRSPRFIKSDRIRYGGKSRTKKNRNL
jgi:hypothetical protein